MFAYIQFFESVRKVVLIYVWKTNPEPGVLQSKIDFFFTLFVVIPELSLFIYGNVMIAND